MWIGQLIWQESDRLFDTNILKEGFGGGGRSQSHWGNYIIPVALSEGDPSRDV